MGTYIYIDKFVLTEETTCECDSNSIIKDKTRPIIYDNPNYSKIRMPYINIDSIDAEKLNNEIEVYYTKSLKLNDKSDIDDFPLFYDYYSNTNTLSIICVFRPASVNYYKAVNIDLKTGKRVDNLDLILASNVNRDEIKDTMVKIFDDSIDQERETYYKATTLPGEEENMYDKNINYLKNLSLDDTEMYLNNSGELCIIVDEYQPAGSEVNRKIMNINKKEYEKITE